MSVFISWSGKNTKSYMVAVALRRWLEQVVQGCNPWVSTQDIDAGERWGTELFTQLDNHNVGIICVTKENQAEPWLNFEAGALANMRRLRELLPRCSHRRPATTFLNIGATYPNQTFTGWISAGRRP